MDFRILGPLEVIQEGRALPLGGVRQRALLAILLLHANELVPTDTLVDRLWGGSPPRTARKALQVYVSQLRKTLGADVLLSRAPGYVLRVEPGSLDLGEFERLVREARESDPASAARLLAEALSLWRGAPLADLAYEAFAQAEILRLEELRAGALEDRIDADLSRGLDAELVPELERQVAEHPLRERFRGQLMLALYRSGRQAKALEVFQEGRRLLDEELGLEPGETLKALQRAILAHDAALEPAAAASARADPRRSILLVAPMLDDLDVLLSLGEPFGRTEPARELVLVQVTSPAELAPATVALRNRRDRLLSEGLMARAAAFCSPQPGEDLARLASQHEADLILLGMTTQGLEQETRALLERASSDVALFVVSSGPLGEGPVIVPFGAAEHDWTALEVGAWVARATGAELRLIGAAADAREDARDASRLLADASLIVQRTADVVAEPLLASPGREGVMALAEGAGLLVVGLSERWRKEGLGKVRAEIAAAPPAPTAFVRRGLRPGGMAPAETRTRFTWSLTSAAAR